MQRIYFDMKRVIVVALVFIIGIFITYQMNKPKEKLRIFTPADINPILVDSTLKNKNIKHRIASFNLIDQNGNSFTEKELEGKIYVTDFFFTTCPTICPKMSDNLKNVYAAFKNDNDIMLVSHSVTPEIDTPEILAEYAKKYDADRSKWVFLTGAKTEIYELARKSYFVVTDEGTGDEHDFIHTENFVLIDKEKRIRGYYDGTDEKEIERLIKEINILKKEYEN